MIVLPNGTVIPDQAMANARAIDETNLRNRQIINQLAAEQMRNRQALLDSEARERVARMQQVSTERMANARLAEIALDRQSRERIETERGNIDRERIKAGSADLIQRGKEAEQLALLRILGDIERAGIIGPQERAAAIIAIDKFHTRQKNADTIGKVLHPDAFSERVRAKAVELKIMDEANKEKQEEILADAVNDVVKEISGAYPTYVGLAPGRKLPKSLDELDTFYRSNTVPITLKPIEIPKGLQYIVDNADRRNLKEHADTLRGILANRQEPSASPALGGAGIAPPPVSPGPTQPAPAAGPFATDEGIYGAGGGGAPPSAVVTPATETTVIGTPEAKAQELKVRIDSVTAENQRLMDEAKRARLARQASNVGPGFSDEPVGWGGWRTAAQNPIVVEKPAPRPATAPLTAPFTPLPVIDDDEMPRGFSATDPTYRRTTSDEDE